MSRKIEELEKLAKIAGIEVKHSKAYQLVGKPSLPRGAVFQLIYNPCKNKEQAFYILSKAGMTLQVNDGDIVANGECFIVEDFDKPRHALCYAIWEGALK